MIELTEAQKKAIEKQGINQNLDTDFPIKEKKQNVDNVSPNVDRERIY